MRKVFVFNLMVHPVVLGGGSSLRRRDGKEGLKLIIKRTFATGIVVLTYQPVGKESYYGHQD